MSSVGLEVELLAPPGKTRFDLARALAKQAGGALRLSFKYHGQGTLPDGRPDCQLSPAAKVMVRGKWFASVVDDPTILDDLAPLAEGSHFVLDIGTGRGDFLTVLKQAGIPSRGIDLNPEAVKQAVEQGLDVILAGASEHLTSLPDESIGAVTALHVVEHLDPNALIGLVDEIVRVLVPGGVVIFETPNPTNLVVGASSFYHDPTHHRPVTPDYLAFLLHDRGLTDVQTRFLNPLPEFENPTPTFDKPGYRGLELLLDDVRWALKGPQDYAVIGRRPGSR